MKSQIDVEVHVPEANDAQACGNRSNQASREQALRRRMRHGGKHPRGKVCAGPEIPVKEYVAREEKQSAGESAESREPANLVGRFGSHVCPCDRSL